MIMMMMMMNVLITRNTSLRAYIVERYESGEAECNVTVVTSTVIDPYVVLVAPVRGRICRPSVTLFSLHSDSSASPIKLSVNIVQMNLSL